MIHIRLEWLRIHTFRNVEPGTQLTFSPRFNVLLGRNRTGKTTLLELIDRIWSRGFAEIAREPFHLEYAFAADPSPRPAQPDRTRAYSYRVSVKNEAHKRDRERFAFSYRVEVTTPGFEAPLFIVEQTPFGATLTHEGHSHPVAMLTADSGPLVWEAARQYYDLTRGNPRAWHLDDDFSAERAAEWVAIWFKSDDEAFHALPSLGDPGPLGSGLRGVRVQLTRHLDTLQVTPRSAEACSFVPIDILDKFWSDMRRSDRHREDTTFSTSLGDHPILKAFLELTIYTDATVTFRHHERRYRAPVEHLTYRAPEFTFLLPNDAGDIKADSLSDGEKRLLAFLWYLASSTQVVIADEPVNGFHHAWITRSIELVAAQERQAFLTSQNPLLLDALPLEDPEDAQRSFIACHRDPASEGRMRWSNLERPAAEKLYRAYQREIMTLNEILRGHGLW